MWLGVPGPGRVATGLPLPGSEIRARGHRCPTSISPNNAEIDSDVSSAARSARHCGGPRPLCKACAAGSATGYYYSTTEADDGVSSRSELGPGRAPFLRFPCTQHAPHPLGTKHSRPHRPRPLSLFPRPVVPSDAWKDAACHEPAAAGARSGGNERGRRRNLLRRSQV